MSRPPAAPPDVAATYTAEYRAVRATQGRGSRFWIGVVVVWTAIAIALVAQLVLRESAHGEGIVRAPLIGAALLDFFVLALYLPVLFRLVERVPIDALHPMNLVAHLGAALGFVAVKSIVLLPLDRWIFWSASPSLQARVAKALGELVILALVSGLAQAVVLARRLRARERHALALESRLADARLDALRSQLNPHFLFNTLNAVTVLMHRDVQKADMMLTRLADLLRATLKAPAGHEVPLREELALLDRYLDIMQLRFGPRLMVERAVPPGLDDALVPNFLLQPLVENALEHGVSRRTGAGRVSLAVEEAGTRLRLIVTDDGPGIEPNRARWSGPAHESNGIGLSNTRRRLEELYGDDHRLELERVPDVGTRAIVELPLRRSTRPEGGPARRNTTARGNRRPA